MRRWLLDDWGVKLGAGLLAAALWLHAVTERTYRREIDVPLVIEEPPTDPSHSLIVLASPVPPTVRIAVSGTGKDLLRASASDFLMRVHTPGGPPGRQLNLRLDPDHVEIHTDLGLVVEAVVQPTDIHVLLDYSDERTLPVHPRLDLRLAESYTRVGPVRVRPESVRVRGPRSHLRAVAAIVTDSLRRLDVREDFDVEVPLVTPPGRLLNLNRDRVHIAVDVQELAEYDILNVPVHVIGGPANAVAEPSRVTVRVRGGADVIGSLDPETDIGLSLNYEAARAPEGGLIQAPRERLYEIRQITPSRATVVAR